MQNLFFTIVDAKNPAVERPVNFDRNEDQTFKVTFPFYGIHMDQQQLAELGHLMIALSQGNYDNDSVTELLDGFNLLPKPKFGWGWIDGEDDNEGDKWIQISELDYSDPNHPSLGEEIATLMLRNYDENIQRFPGLKEQKEREAQMIVDALNK